MSDLINNLPAVEFADKDAETTLAEIIARYEAASGLTLYPGDPVRLFLETIAYELAYQRSLIDFTGKMNLLAYATGDYLDHIGALVPVARLPAAAATVTVRFSLAEASESATLIPSGTRVTPRSDPDMIFSVGTSSQIPAGSLYADCSCVCVTAGSNGNGLFSGQVLSMIDLIQGVEKAVNITTSAGGSDTETDDNFRERIQLVVESLSVAGPINAYKYWALSASADIVDVGVAGPAEDDAVEPGNVYVYPLLKNGGLPDAELLTAVYDIVDADDIRPLTDTVHVESPIAVNFALTLSYWIASDNKAHVSAIKTAVTTAVKEWITWQKATLGRDINPSELIHRIVAVGAKRAVVTSPAFTALSYKQVGVCTSESISFGGLEDG